MTYPSKKDLWLILVVAVAGFALLGATAHKLIFKGMDHPATWILMGTLIFYLAVIFIVAYPVSYEIAPFEAACSGLESHFQVLNQSNQPEIQPVRLRGLSIDSR